MPGTLLSRAAQAGPRAHDTKPLCSPFDKTLVRLFALFARFRAKCATSERFRRPNGTAPNAIQRKTPGRKNSRFPVWLEIAFVFAHFARKRARHQGKGAEQSGCPAVWLPPACPAACLPGCPADRLPGGPHACLPACLPPDCQAACLPPRCSAAYLSACLPACLRCARQRS